MIMLIAREVTNNAAIEHIVQHAANEEVQIYELEPVAELPRRGKITLEQRNTVLTLMGRKVSAHEPPLRL